MTKKLPTIHSLMADLETAKAQAMANGQFNSVISAVALQAKLLGLDTGKAFEQANTPTPIQVVVDVKDARMRDDNLELLPEYRKS
ncbi:hypothetical protein [Moraxella pluranimalium]|uniref:Uncharacterized protein n=1 Tax=Moraxella pluranimalium TaxID=470453 RepID=A0A1T0CKX7_9GAMM|nr:hypothetical protein [Moraxella pluranimalium]OOS23008.1 hypothetical protein B0680_08455 [Moraxella pluranimalium]